MSQTHISRANSVIGDNDDDEVSMHGGIQALSSKFEKIAFDGKDYPTWKFRFTSMLLGLGLLGIVEGTADETARGYKSRRDYVFSMLVMSMTDATIKFAKGAKAGDAKAVWDSLSAEFERNTRFNKLNLRRQLYDCAGDRGLPIVSLVGKIDLICSRLESLQTVISDEDKLAVLLSGAGKKFEAVVAMLELASETGNLTYSIAAEKLKDFSSGRENNSIKGPDNGVLAVKVPLDEVLCYKCKKMGHYKRDCPEQKKISVVSKSINSW
jgi:hypothetical protein